MAIVHDEINRQESDVESVLMDNVILEETLGSIGALSAAPIVRRSYPDASGTVRRFDQHHDNDMDIPERIWKMYDIKRP